MAEKKHKSKRGVNKKRISTKRGIKRDMKIGFGKSRSLKTKAPKIRKHIIKQRKPHNYAILIAVLIIAFVLFLLISKLSAVEKNTIKLRENIISEMKSLELEKDDTGENNIIVELDKEKLEELSRMPYSKIKKSFGIADDEDIRIYIENSEGHIIPIDTSSEKLCIGDPDAC